MVGFVMIDSWMMAGCSLMVRLFFGIAPPISSKKQYEYGHGAR
jgi:hypothetical protein